MLDGTAQMKHFSATDAKNKFGELIDEAMVEPILVQKNGRDAVVILSKAAFDKLGDTQSVRPLVKELHKRSIERRRKVYEALAK